MAIIFKPNTTDLQLVITLSEGRCTVDFIGCWAPRELSYAQKAIADQYRAERRKIAQGYKKSTQYMKTKTRELKEKERELKHKEQRINDKPDPLGHMAHRFENELKDRIAQAKGDSLTQGAQDARSRNNGNTVERGQGPADTNGAANSGTADAGTECGSSEPSDAGTAEGPAVRGVPETKSRRQGTSGGGKTTTTGKS